MVDAEVEAAKAQTNLDELRIRTRVLEQLITEEAGTLAAAPVAQEVPVQDVPTVVPPKPEAAVSEPTGSAGPLAALRITEAIRLVLNQSDRPLGPSEVMDRLTAGGLPQEDTAAVRGALAWLKKKGTAATRGRSNWVMIDSPADLAVRSGQLGPEFAADADDSTDPGAQEASDINRLADVGVQS